MRSHTHPQLDSLPNSCAWCKPKPKSTNNCLSPPISQNTPASISSILPQSSSDLDTDHGDMIDETMKHVTHTINQTLLTSNVSSTTTNKASNDPPIKIYQAYNPSKT